MRNGINRTGSSRRLSLVTDGGIENGTPLSPQTPDDFADADISEARTSPDREALQQFRRRVRIMDMNRPRFDLSYQGHARHDNLETGGVQLVASCHGTIVGTVQINYAFVRDLGVDADFYRMREVAGTDHPAHTCIISRLLVEPAWRGRTLGRQLCVAAYCHALRENARTAFLRCHDPLIYYFSALGFKPYMGKSSHTQYGEVLPMKLDLRDETYLAMVHSPFVDALRDWKRASTPEVRVVPQQDRS